MRPILAFAICGLSLGACTSSDIFKFETAKEQVTLRIESEPPGADAKLSSGGSCKTPCDLPVEAGIGRVNVTFSLPGYQPELQEVEIVPGLGAERARANPNPVMAELDPAPPGTAVRRPAPKKKAAPKKAAASPAAKPAAKRPAAKKAARPAPVAAPAPAPAAAPAPATTQSSPWPAAPAPAQQ